MKILSHVVALFGTWSSMTAAQFSPFPTPYPAPAPSPYGPTPSICPFVRPGASSFEIPPWCLPAPAPAPAPYPPAPAPAPYPPAPSPYPRYSYSYAPTPYPRYSYSYAQSPMPSYSSYPFMFLSSSRSMYDNFQSHTYGQVPTPYGVTDFDWCKDMWNAKKCGQIKKKGMCKGHSHGASQAQNHCLKSCGYCF